VEAMLTGIIDAAKQGDEINLTGFGKFKVRNSPARQGRNPATPPRASSASLAG
jgi:DNA-binding protein HU-beta